MRRLVSLLLVLVLVPVCAGAELTAWFLDVGQGDCTVIVCDGETVSFATERRSADGEEEALLF